MIIFSVLELVQNMELAFLWPIDRALKHQKGNFCCSYVFRRVLIYFELYVLAKYVNRPDKEKVPYYILEAEKFDLPSGLGFPLTFSSCSRPL
jgi:hypothetical protein